MFGTFFKFELGYWLKGVMVFIFLFILTLLVTLAASIDEVQLGRTFANIDLNSPYIIQFFYGLMGILTCLMTTAFVNDAASRDFAYKTDQLIFTKPINKYSFLLARFFGSAAIALVPMLGVSLGILLAPSMPWAPDGRFGAVNWTAHLWAVLVFAIPNTIFISAIVFAIAVWLRSTFASFIGVIVLLTAWGITQSITGSLDNETLVSLADPFGMETFDIQTKYWTAADRNTSYLTLANSSMLLNRLLWMGVGLTILGITCWRFSFAERRQRSKSSAQVGTSAVGLVALPKVSFQHGLAAQLKQFLSQFKIDFISTVKSPVFLVVVFMGMIDTFTSLRFVATEGFGLKALPVTYSMIEIISGSLYSYMMIVIIFYAGVLVWKERESKLDEVFDALPHSVWISYLAKLATIMAIVLIVITAEILMAMAVQASEGYTRFQLALYAKELYGLMLIQLFCLTVAAFFMHIIAPNKYIGYFLFIIFVIANAFAWSATDIESNMVQFGSLSSYVYSDMFGFAPFSKALSWFSTYWVVFCAFLSCIGLLLWQRGRDRGFMTRIMIGVKRFSGKMAAATLLAFAAWAGVAGWVYYNTEIQNTYLSEGVQKGYQSEYEKAFKETYENKPQPRVLSLKYDIDVYPKRRGLVFKGVQKIVNLSEQPITELFVNSDVDFETEISVEGAEVSMSDEDQGVQIFEFDPPLQPDQASKLEFTVSYESKGFENDISQIRIVQNGSFFDTSLVPTIGYQRQRELTEKDDREHVELGERAPMAALDADNLAARGNTYLSNSSDWVDLETVISTSNDQIAVAPGSLVKKWEKDGRRYFRYKLDHKSLNFFSFISADYKVALRKWKDVDIEVYYHHEHEWNVSNMLRSIGKSLEYYTEEFGPYKHQQARIIEFPRHSSFAQAFPGTMPYSEGIGFIASIKEEDDIDMVYYVVAHEMAHQWWAHQVIGANMEGATLLSETLAQYSALMVMEREFGRDIMRKFLKYEMDQYLSSRGSETKDEQPLLKVNSSQGYIHYRKGSVAMYYLKEMIGEDKVNAGLRSLIKKFAYAGPPYPTSIDLVEALRQQTPEEYHYLLVDLFEKITLFENRTLNTTYEKLPDGKFKIDLEIECKKFQADEKGKQTQIKIDDWIEIGAFAKAEGDSEYVKTLYRKRVKIDKEKSNFSFVVDDFPEEAGVDPFSLLIERMPEDNMKKPKKK